MTLPELISLMRKERVLRISNVVVDDLPATPSLIVELHPSAFDPAQAAAALDTTPAPVGVEHGGEPTEEQILFWSAGGALPKAVKEEVA